MRFAVLFSVLAIVLAACASQPASISLPTLTAVPTTATSYVDGVLLADEDHGMRIGQNAIIIDSQADLMSQNTLIQSRQGEDVIFACNISYKPGDNARYGISFILRLCHMPPGTSPRLIQPFAYHVMDTWSPDGNWYVFAGATDGTGMICDQRLYAYNRHRFDIIDITPQTDSPICSISEVEWKQENGENFISFRTWIGGDQSDPASFDTYQIPFHEQST